MRNPHHPTRERLVEVVVGILHEKPAEEITMDEVLQASGISKGSLYHHFLDFSDLLDVALAAQFASYVDETIAGLTNLVAHVKSETDFWTGLGAITLESQAAENRPRRFTRLQVAARAARNEDFRQLLALEQGRLTVALADLVREGQHNGWLNQDIDPFSVAVLIQAYTLGRSLDDISDEHVDPVKWNALILRLVRKTLEP